MKKLALAIIVAVGVTLAGFLVFTNQSDSASDEKSVISNTNRGEPQAEVTPVPVFGGNQAKVSNPNPLKFHYAMMLDDFGLAMYLLQNKSLYDDKVEFSDMPDLYMIAYSSAKKVLEKNGNVLPPEDEVRDLMDKAFETAKKNYAEHPELFQGGEGEAYMRGFGVVFANTILNSIHVYATDEIEGSIEEALSTAFDKVTIEIGDKYAGFLPPQEAQSMEDSLNETLHFSGIGARIGLSDDQKGVEIVYTYTGSPAHLAGLLPGDIIMKIRGEEVQASDYEQIGEVTTKIKGDAGTLVILEVKRGTETLEFQIERQPIQGTTAVAYRHGSYGHVVLSSFGDDSEKDIQRALDMLVVPGNPLKGIILDLRENGGGHLDTAIRVYDMFEKAKVKVVTTTSNHVKDRSEVSDTDNRNTRVFDTQDNTLITVPLVILINNHSASASEIISGAMQDNGRAYVIGTKSYGKGVAQGILPLYGDPFNHPTVKFTTDEFFVGKDKVRIHQIGVTPDLTIDQGIPANLTDPKNDEDAMMRNDVMTRIIHRSDPTKDPLLKAGLEYLDQHQ